MRYGTRLVVGAVWLAAACALPRYRYEDDGTGGSGSSDLGGDGSDGDASGGAGEDGSGSTSASGGAESGSGSTGSGGATPVCATEDVDCANDGVTPRTCIAGQWREEDACPFVCTNGMCETSCPEGDRQCADGTLLECSGGTWAEEDDCEFFCNDEVDPPACGGECVPGTTHCVDATQIETCNLSGSYDPPVTCENTACRGDPATCSGDCFPGDRACDDNVVEVCTDSGVYEDEADCTETEETCEEDAESHQAACMGECAPGQDTCVGWDVHTCVDGAYELETPCEGPGQICRAYSIAACDVNYSYNVGESDETAAWADFSAVTDTIYWAPIVVTKRALVVTFRVRLPSDPPGTPTAFMALYEDDAANDRPGDLLTDSGAMSLGPNITDGVVNDQTILEPGTYWLGIQFSVDGIPFSDRDGGGYSSDSDYPTYPPSYLPAQSGATLKTYPLFLALQDSPN